VSADLPVLGAHDHGGTLIAHAGFFLEQWEKHRFFPDDVSLQAELELLEGLFGPGEIDLLQLPVSFQ
jgi:hypothetical protein